MTHFESIYDIFRITVRELIKSDVDRLTMPSIDAKGQQVLNSAESLKNTIDNISREEWEKVHK